MKTKTAFAALVMAVIFFCSNTAYGATGDVMSGMWHKLIRGGANVLTGWLELPMQTVKGYKKGEDFGDKLLGGAGGFFKGIFHTIGRTAWGVVELAGFWTANPEDNTGIGASLDSEYAWEEGMRGSYEISYPDIEIGSIGKKFGRGLENTVFGLAEFPGQIASGLENKVWDIGIIKGLWFAASREIYGIADLVTLIFPMPEDNPGYYFEQEYPWDALADAIEVKE